MRTYLQFLLLCIIAFVFIESSKAKTKNTNGIKTIQHKKPSHGIQTVRHKKPTHDTFTYGLATLNRKKPTRKTKAIRSKKPGAKAIKSKFL
jgi:hypothetical protein